jgi:TonB family protein
MGATGEIQRRRLHPWRFGVASSVLLHVVIVFLILFRVLPDYSHIEPPVIYSISIEGGKSLGGVSKVVKDPPKELPVAKNAPELEQPKVEPPKPKDEPKSEPKPPKVEKVEKAEVSLNEKDKKKTAPKATATPAKKAAEKKSDDYSKLLQKYLGNSSKAGGQGFGAASLGGKSTGGGQVESPEFIAYRDALEAHIKSGWRWPSTGSHLVSKVRFKIDQKGHITEIELVTTSGSREYDNATVTALFKADPAPAPPASVYERFATSKITFDTADR